MWLATVGRALNTQPYNCIVLDLPWVAVAVEVVRTLEDVEVTHGMDDDENQQEDLDASRRTL
eukprot:13647597-Alexandrium_andersonii.AAC.1